MKNHQLLGPIGEAKGGTKFGIVNQRKENLSEKQRSLCQLPEHEVKLLTNQLTKEIYGTRKWQDNQCKDTYS
jgi:hypothetical protein